MDGLDEKFMLLALKEAHRASQLNEVPVGAIWVLNNQIYAKGHNLRETKEDPLSHAEIEVINKAAKRIKSWRLGGTLYVTLEPCPMCAGAILQARIERLVFGCPDPKSGAAGSVINLLDKKLPWNHQVSVTGGILQHGCKQIIQDFFQNLRYKQLENPQKPTRPIPTL